ncbi:MAG: hypothetical protein V4760_17760 [Bdellovibrionota bacterium]
MIRIVRAGFLIAAALLLQNCTQPVPYEGPSELEKLAEDLPFSYDAKIDQIAHLSCSDVKQDNSAGGLQSPYFTMRAGAYRNGGLQLNDAFYASVGRKPIDKQSEILSMSPQNAQTVLQLSMRSRSGYQTLYTRTGTVLQGQDYSNMLAPLGDPGLSNQLVNLPQDSMIRYVRSGRAGGYRFEGDLVFTDNYTLWNDFKTKMNSTFLLAMTYTHGGTGNDKEYSARAPADFGTATQPRDRAVYGVGYELGFSVPAGRSTNYPYAVLQNVAEKNLETRTGSGTWNCSSSLQLRVVRAEDAGSGLSNCRKMVDPTNLTGAEKFRLEIIRNSFRVEDWYVDLTNSCIIPKRPESCYGATTTQVAYPLNDACTVTGETGKGHCLAYASICYRN